MSTLIYRRENFVILKVSRGFVVRNERKNFNKGHTHVMRYKTAEDLIEYALSYEVPLDSGNYFLTGLVRLSTNKNYIEKLWNRVHENNVENEKGEQKQRYYNSFYKRNNNKKGAK